MNNCQVCHGFFTKTRLLKKTIHIICIFLIIFKDHRKKSKLLKPFDLELISKSPPYIFCKEIFFKKEILDLYRIWLVKAVKLETKKKKKKKTLHLTITQWTPCTSNTFVRLCVLCICSRPHSFSQSKGDRRAKKKNEKFYTINQCERWFF